MVLNLILFGGGLVALMLMLIGLAMVQHKDVPKP